MYALELWSVICGQLDIQPSASVPDIKGPDTTYAYQTGGPSGFGRNASQAPLRVSFSVGQAGGGTRSGIRVVFGV